MNFKAENINTSGTAGSLQSTFLPFEQAMWVVGLDLLERQCHPMPCFVQPPMQEPCLIY